MSIAERYLREQLSSEEFRHSYLEEKMKLDIEYRLEELKTDIQKRKSPDELIQKVEDLEKFVMAHSVKAAKRLESEQPPAARQSER